MELLFFQTIYNGNNLVARGLPDSGRDVFTVTGGRKIKISWSYFISVLVKFLLYMRGPRTCSMCSLVTIRLVTFFAIGTATGMVIFGAYFLPYFVSSLLLLSDSAWALRSGLPQLTTSLRVGDRGAREASVGFYHSLNFDIKFRTFHGKLAMCLNTYVSFLVVIPLVAQIANKSLITGKTVATPPRQVPACSYLLALRG